MPDERRSVWLSSVEDWSLLSEVLDVNEEDGGRAELESAVTGFGVLFQLKPLEPPPGPRSNSLLFLVKFCF